MRQYEDTAQGVLQFWRDAGPQRWFRKDFQFDQDFRRRWEGLHMAAARRERDDWARTADGVLALLILLDQFPRNAYRGTAHMFATDPLARHFARLAVDGGLDAQVDVALRAFCYMPFEHSENLDDQATAVRLMAALDPHWLDFAIVHQRIIERFGRFPHRNPQLGRESTAEELRFLAEGGFSG
ncbi:Uncharacterized protein conserved in bacteria [Bordetella ansorpii]|uniref:Uncharacterized protein conserved in bacteria n=1 Tax=Bordetella ansorpii TaxID=288768 RepID=A0A157SNZ5_9BORD|nr:DUF924 family protein [Bordetella ansorpii]SAI72132.1 Uncharacterized protein conserved in bacteria [Bordetella ansorpii]